MDDTTIIYGTSWCPDCIRAKKVFHTQGVEYKWINIGEDADARAYVEEVNNGCRSVPTIIFQDGDILVEPSNSALEEKLAQLVR